MHLQTLKEGISRFRKQLSRSAPPEVLARYEAQYHFQQAWDPEAPDFAAMLERCLQARHSRRLWSRSGYEPRAVLLALARYAPELVRTFFQELFAERRSVEDRLDRFVFHLDELFADYRAHVARCPWPAHFHDDGYRMASHYLAFRFPQNYAPYELELMQALLRHLRAPNVPLSHDLERYFKVMRLLRKFLLEDEEIVHRHEARLASVPHVADNHLLLTEELARFMTGLPF